MNRVPCCLLLVMGFAAGTANPAGLPDTGQDLCFAGIVADVVPAANAISVARDAGPYPRQDCRYGRDAAAAAGALPKTGAGAKGFDYTKIANNGSALAADASLGSAATDWACTRDNVTGLTWEVKTAISTDLRYSEHTYTWRDSDGDTNGGSTGIANGGICLGGTGCDTESFVADVNAAALCTHVDWRMPTVRELLTLTYGDGSKPSIAPTYFSNTMASNFWSGSSFAPNASNAWSVRFDVGYTDSSSKSDGYYVRLVRGGVF